VSNLLDELNSQTKEREMSRRLRDELIDLGFTLVERAVRSAAAVIIPRTSSGWARKLLARLAMD
jgi:hypothetical protein